MKCSGILGVFRKVLKKVGPSADQNAFHGPIPDRVGRESARPGHSDERTSPDHGHCLTAATLDVAVPGTDTLPKPQDSLLATGCFSNASAVTASNCSS